MPLIPFISTTNLVAFPNSADGLCSCYLSMLIDVSALNCSVTVVAYCNSVQIKVIDSLTESLVDGIRAAQFHSLFLLIIGLGLIP